MYNSKLGSNQQTDQQNQVSNVIHGVDTYLTRLNSSSVGKSKSNGSPSNHRNSTAFS